ncbi:MAG: Veg family protein [Candidatus Geothermincolales bacterium]
MTEGTRTTGIESKNIADIMEMMRQLVGKVVRLSVKESKPKTHWEEKVGVIEGVYPTVFLFRYKNSRNVDERVAYSYVDVAIDDVKILDN